MVFMSHWLLFSKDFGLDLVYSDDLPSNLHHRDLGGWPLYADLRLRPGVRRFPQGFEDTSWGGEIPTRCGD